LIGSPDFDDIRTEILSLAAIEWAVRANEDSALRAPLLKLASAAARNHQDFWLEDLLRSESPREALLHLQSAISANSLGDPEQAESEAKFAERMFFKSGNIPGLIRSHFEILFALHRQSKSRDCLKEARLLNRLAAGKKYSWIFVQGLIESSICEAMAGNFDQAWDDAHSSVSKADQFRYPSLRLRALGIEASLHTAEGRYRQSWAANEAGLEEFWKGKYPAERGFQFYSDLAFQAEALGHWYVAGALQREAIAILSASKHADFKASAHFRLGTVEEITGDHENARREFDLASQLFRNLPANSTTHMYEADSMIALAAVEARLGIIQSAVRDLERVHGDISKIDNFTIQLRYWKARALVARAQQENEQAHVFLQRAIRIGNDGYRSLRSERDRWEWRREVGSSYLELLEEEMTRPHDALGALADWEAFRTSEIQGDFSEQITHNVNAERRLTARLRRLRNATLISFATFDNRIFVWVSDSRGVREFKLAAGADYIRSHLQLFSSLCSDPDTPVASVKRQGALLYEALLAPFAQTFQDRPELIIEFDQTLDGLPWSALVAGDGRYLGQSHDLTIISGLLGRWRKSGKGGVQSQRALVAVPGSVIFQGQRYLPLPQADREAEYIARLYPGAICLRGRDANSQQLVKYLTKATIFHFAGHAVSRKYGGELLLAGTDRGGFSSARLANIRLRRCRLVVLSACSTSAAEFEAARDPNGLVQAFLVAGAERVIASRWDVDSQATETLMRRFYQSFRDGGNASSAMRAAQEQTQNEAGTRHPFYWAAFEVFGTTP
jgi:CHAT domain-containing protein